MNFLVKVFGFPATLIHGDTLVLDRWNWLKNNLPEGKNDKTLLDVGCGTGAFTIGAALRGYQALGLSWDERNQTVASQRATLCNANAAFSICDVRDLDERKDLVEKFDYIVCTENIEHIINDNKLMRDMSNCLKRNGKLLLTTPNFDFRPMFGDTRSIKLPVVEDGGHVKIGYTENELRQLCQQSGFQVSEVGYCSGFFSQKITSLQRMLTWIHPAIGWVVILPLRVIPVLFDRFAKYPGYSICLVATKA